MAKRTIDLYLSGGASNSDPDLSLGGVESTVKLYGQTPVFVAAAPAGITLIDSASDNGGTLVSLADKTAYWQKDGSASGGTAVSITTDDQYTLDSFEEDDYVTISVVAASLQTVQTLNSAVTVTDIANNLYNDVLEPEALSGSVKYRHFYIKNLSIDDIKIRMYVKQQLTGLDVLEFGFSTTTSGTPDAILTDEDTAPVGVSFDSPSPYNYTPVLNILAGESIGVFLKRTVRPLTDISTPRDTARLLFEEYILRNLIEALE